MHNRSIILYINDAIHIIDKQSLINSLIYIVSYVDINIIGLCHSVAFFLINLCDKCHVMWLRFHLKQMLIMGLDQ